MRHPIIRQFLRRQLVDALQIKLRRAVLGFSFGGLLEHRPVIDPDLEKIVRIQRQLDAPGGGDIDGAIELIHSVHPVEFVNEDVRFPVFELRLGTPLYLFAHAGIRFVQLDFLLRVVLPR